MKQSILIALLGIGLISANSAIYAETVVDATAQPQAVESAQVAKAKPPVKKHQHKETTHKKKETTKKKHH